MKKKINKTIYIIIWSIIIIVYIYSIIKYALTTTLLNVVLLSIMALLTIIYLVNVIKDQEFKLNKSKIIMIILLLGVVFMSRKILIFDKEFNDFVESFIEYDEAIPVLENNGINKDDILAYHSLAKHANIYTYKNQQLVSYTIDKEKITSTYTYTFNHDIEIIKETIISDSYYDLSFYAYQDDQLSYYRFNFQFDENNNSITKLEGNETFIAKKDQPFDEAYLQQLIKAYNYYNYNSLETKDYLFTSDLDYIQAVVLSENKDKYDYTGLQIDLYSPMNYIGAFRILGDYDENIQIKQIDNQVIIGPIQVNAQEGTSYTYEKIITIYDDYCEESANIL